MTTEPSPRPWRVNGHSIEANDPDGLWLQNEKTGWGVVANLPSCPKSKMSKKDRETWDAIVEANASLIVDAVNNIDRLRDELDVERSQHCTDIEQAEYHAEHHRKILEAERDRLRDLVRRLLVAIDAMNTLIVRLNPHMMPVDVQPGATCLGVDVGDVVREAREAIGEETK